MKNKIMLVAVVFAMWSAGSAHAQTAADSAAVLQAGRDYIEGLYDGDAEKLQRSVRPDVAKSGFARRQNMPELQTSIMTYQGFFAYADRVKKEGGTPPERAAIRDVRILDLLDHTAAIKITAWWGTDYVLLGKFNNRWMISHVLWQSPPLRTSGIVPRVDHHQHLVSPGTAEMINARLRPGSPRQDPIDAKRLVALLDTAGIKQAVVLSGAFTFGGHNFDARRDTMPADRLAALVRAENDWTANEVAKYPERLVAFCSFHPQAAHAMSELRRCASSKRFRGVKVHLEESDVDLTKPADAAALRAVFAEANRLQLPIVIHVRNNRSDARATAAAFLKDVLPAAPNITVQIAHLAGGGAYSEAALSVYADAVAAGQPVTRNLVFDVTEVSRTARDAGARRTEVMTRMVELMRRIGMERMLYGSDPAVFGRLAPREGWAEFVSVMPLTPAEISTIADNVAPYLRE